MKKLGIIGGAGPLASALFYETLIQESYRLQRFLPEILLINFPFNRGLTPQEQQKNGSLLQAELLHCMHVLEAGGANQAVLVCNTLHLELAKIPRGLVCFFSLPELVLEEIKKDKKKRLLLLGTQNLCRSSLYQQGNLMIFQPSSEGQKIVDAAIDHVLEGKISEADSESIEQLIRSYPEEIDGVILGCTDLPVLHHHFPIRTDKAIYDSVKISARTILRFL